jgi:hypothetical protein
VKYGILADPVNDAPLRISSRPVEFGTGDHPITRKPRGYCYIVLGRMKNLSALSRERGKIVPVLN